MQELGYYLYMDKQEKIKENKDNTNDNRKVNVKSVYDLESERATPREDKK